MGFVMGTILRLCKGYNSNHPSKILLGVHLYCVIWWPGKAWSKLDTEAVASTYLSGL